MTENLLVSLNDIEEKEASWLVPQRMPKGQIIILAGDGGSGKTSCWCSLAAAISTGAQVFFDETPKEFFESEPQKVLFFSSEDSLEYTLKARLRKAGANFNNIFSVDLKNERFSEIKFNSKLLKELIEQVKPALIVFDPLQAFIPVDMQMGQRNAMRACLSPLIGSRSSFCVRAVQNIAKKSEIRLTVPTEDAAIRVIDEANNRLKEIVHIYDGKFLFGDRNKNQSLIMDAHGYEDSGFLGRLEKEYQAATLEDIKISRMSRKEFDTKNAVTRVDEMKKPVELVEVGEDIGIRAKDDVSSSLAARYAKAYSERMSTVNPEFE